VQLLANQEASSSASRGRSVQELCRHHSFEELAYLAWQGHAPTRDQILEQNRVERAQRALHPSVVAAITRHPATAYPMDVLQTAVRVLGANDPAGRDISPAAVHAKTLRLFAALPSVIALDQRRRRGLGPVAPRADLGYAANFLYMTFGKLPEPQIIAAFEKSLILYGEHGIDGSTRGTRAIPFAPADVHSAVATVIGELRGPLSGGPSEAVIEMLNEIAFPYNAGPWLEEATADGRTIHGFGRLVPGSSDAGVPVMRTALGMIASLRRGQHVIEVYEALATAMFEATGLRPNLDYPASPAYQLIGFDPDAFSQILVAARLPSWTAHIARRLAPRHFSLPAPAASRLRPR
jgi:citrate synthase